MIIQFKYIHILSDKQTIHCYIFMPLVFQWPTARPGLELAAAIALLSGWLTVTRIRARGDILDQYVHEHCNTQCVLHDVVIQPMTKSLTSLIKCVQGVYYYVRPLFHLKSCIIVFSHLALSPTASVFDRNVSVNVLETLVGHWHNWLMNTMCLWLFTLWCKVIVGLPYGS